MKIILFVLLTACALLKAEYPRHKPRGPPHQSRIPPSKQFSKKWHHQSQQHPPPRGPPRTRPPIPVHMQQVHKLPMNVPQIPLRNVALPARTFWKNPQNINLKIPQEKPLYVPTSQDKPFLAAPSINPQEHDYHIQTNNIPTTHANPIKQVGEKGPIHTIPAPNLSLKDKPIVVEDFKFQQVKTPFQNVEHGHQYHVTEQPELMTKAKLYRGQQQQLLQQQQQQLYQLQLQQQQRLQQQQMHQPQYVQLQQERFLQHEPQKQVEVQPQQQVYYTTDTIGLPQTINIPTQKTPQGDIYLSSELNPKELYRIIGAAYPEQHNMQIQDQQQNFFQQQKGQQQQVPDYQALLSQQLFQSEQQNLAQHVQQTDNVRVASDKVSFEPEFHSFNYDEQAHQKSQKKGLSKEQLSSLVTAAYSLDSNMPSTEPRNSLDPLAQAQLIQSYFDTRPDDDEENNVEPDAKPSMKNEPETIKEELLSSGYFSSLPSKEAADRLAELQAAGKINSNLMNANADDRPSAEESEEPEDDENRDNSNENYPESGKDQSEYEDYSQENENLYSDEQIKDFGDKLAANRKN